MRKVVTLRKGYEAATWVVVGGLILGLGLRWWCARGDLWLDEISSIDMALGVESPLEVVTAIHHDNNHHSTTLWLFVLGDGRSSLAYRSLSVTAACLLLVWLVLVLRERGHLEALAALVLVGGSFFVVVPSTEARGYALMLLGAFATWRCLERWMAGGRTDLWALMFGVAASLTLLSHLTGLSVVVGSATWVLVHGWRRGDPARRRLKAFVTLFGLPLLTLLVLYLVDIRVWQVGGGPIVPKTEAAARSAALALGLSGEGVTLVLGPLVLGAVVLRQIGRQRRAGDDRWSFFAVSILLAPALMSLMSGFPVTYARYFLLPVFLALLLSSHELAGWWSRGVIWKCAALAALVLIGIGNAWHFAHFLGGPDRGQYSEAVARIVADGAPSPVTLASDHDFRTGTVLGFFLRRDHPDFSFRYVGVAEWEREQPDWLIIHTPEPGLQGQPGLRTPGGFYRLVGTYRHYGPSGFDWFLYRRSS